MVMLSFDNMDLKKIGLDAFDPADLYCTDNSPLQNQTLYPGCYGICAVRSPSFGLGIRHQYKIPFQIPVSFTSDAHS